MVTDFSNERCLANPHLKKYADFISYTNTKMTKLRIFLEIDYNYASARFDNQDWILVREVQACMKENCAAYLSSLKDCSRPRTSYRIHIRCWIYEETPAVTMLLTYQIAGNIITRAFTARQDFAVSYMQRYVKKNSTAIESVLTERAMTG